MTCAMETVSRQCESLLIESTHSVQRRRLGDRSGRVAVLDVVLVEVGHVDLVEAGAGPSDQLERACRSGSATHSAAVVEKQRS
jgi:hypothetical protein